MLNCTALFTAQVQNLIDSVAEYERQKSVEREKTDRMLTGSRHLVSKMKAKQQTTRERILLAIATHGPLAPSDVSDRSGLCIETVRLHLRSLASHGEIANAGTVTRPRWVVSK